MNYSVSKAKLKFVFKDLAILSIIAYIIISVTYDGTGLGNAAWASYGIYICAAMCGANMLFSAEITVRKTYIFTIVFGFLLLASTSYSPVEVTIGDMYLYRFWTSALLFVLVANTITTREDIEKLLKACVFAGAFLSINIYAKYGITELADAEDRLLSDISDINMLGVYCGFSIIIASIYMVFDKKHRFLYFSSIIISVPFLMFTGSRKAVLLVVVGLLAFVFTYKNERGLFLRLLAALAVLGIIVFLIMNVPAFSVIRIHFEDMINLFRGAGEIDQGDINRMEYLERGWQYFLEKPFAGNGFFSSFYYFNAYTHCNYVELLMNNGILGFAVYYLMRLLILSKAIACRRKNDILAAMMIMIGVGILFCDIGVVTYYNRFLFVLIAISDKATTIFRGER